MELAVKIVRVCFPPETESGASWFILQTDKGTCKGKLAWRPKENETLILFGERTTYRGSPEFSFDGGRLDIPADMHAQLVYVCERTSGMGTAIQDQLWQKYGANWKLATPGSLPRFGGALYERFRLQCESLAQNQAQAEVVGSLIDKGCTPLQAQKAWDAWKTETIGVVNADPFRLAELERVSFKDVDTKIRQAYGITDNDPRRIKTAVVHTLRKLTETGSTVCSWEQLFSNACAALGGYDDLVHAATMELLKCGTLKCFPDAGMICLASDYRSENDIWEYVTRAT